jgi:hypothetical protein
VKREKLKPKIGRFLNLFDGTFEKKDINLFVSIFLFFRVVAYGNRITHILLSNKSFGIRYH